MPRDEPSFIVARGECDELGAQFLDCFERPHPEQVFLQGSDEVPHHPHAGEHLTVVRRLLYAGDAHFVVELPDGDRLLLPAWMTETGAATPPMVATPRLSFACLWELRRLIDQQDVSLSPSLEAIRNDGGDDGTAHPRAATQGAVRIWPAR